MENVIAFSSFNESIQFDRCWASSMRPLAISTPSQASFSLSELLFFIRKLKPSPQQQEAGREHLSVLSSVFTTNPQWNLSFEELWVDRLKEPSVIPRPHWDSWRSLFYHQNIPQSCSQIWPTHWLSLIPSLALWVAGGRKELGWWTTHWAVGMLVPWGQLGLLLGQYHTQAY